ncbi:MAG: PIG-L family deacetylase [Desulfobacteraceae bacterium]|nr:PIG-L family deacetylase [Desulfobacteraceae bacterium]
MNILLLAPHADDIELGCGATVARFAEEGHSLLWVVFTDEQPLNNEHMKATEEIGLKDESRLAFDFTLRRLSERRKQVLEQLVELNSKFKPDLVVGPSLHDFHQDHQVVANEMVRAFKTSASIICYELPWNHISFDVQLLAKLNIRHLQAKVRMLAKFESELLVRGRYFSEELTHGMALLRGTQAGTKYAEAFEVLRWIL